METYYKNIIDKIIRKGLIIVVLVILISIVIAICQSHRFVSNLWVIITFAIEEWKPHISRMLGILSSWAVVTGYIFVIETIVATRSKSVKRFLLGIIISFISGYISTYILVIIIALMFYVPLGILSFIFPDQVLYLSIGFALLCSTYTVFLLILLDTPALLFSIIREASIYLKLLAVLYGILLISQLISTILSLLLVIMKDSIWRQNFIPFVIGIGITLLLSITLVLFFIKKANNRGKIIYILGVFFISIAFGNIIEISFHIGDYGSAIITAIIGPVLFTILCNYFEKNKLIGTSIIVGIILGLGLGLGLADLIKLRIIGQQWFGLLCGTSIAIGFGISLGFIWGPRIVQVIDKILDIGIESSIGMTVGNIFGILVGTVIGGFINR